VPVLDVEVDIRLADTLANRAAIGDVLLPDGAGLGEREKGEPIDEAIPNSILRELASLSATGSHSRRVSSGAGT